MKIALIFLVSSLLNGETGTEMNQADLASPIAISQASCRIDKKDFPIVGFGTYPLKGKECENAIEQAAGLGYRIIDTATFYDNYEPIGKALKKLGREHFYLISKVWPDQHTPAGIRKDINGALSRLGTDYLDAYLLHWPNSKISIEETLKTMDELRQNKKIRHIGLSNVTINHLKKALELNIPITWIQVEMSPLFYDPELLKFCEENSIAVQAWSPLGRGGLSNEASLIRIGKKYGKSPSQVALRWIIQHGCVPLPRSKNLHHIEENRNVFDFSLSAAEMEEIDDRAKNGERLRITKDFNFGFLDEFDLSYEECWPKKI